MHQPNIVTSHEVCHFPPTAISLKQTKGKERGPVVNASDHTNRLILFKNINKHYNWSRRRYYEMQSLLNLTFDKHTHII